MRGAFDLSKVLDTFFDPLCISRLFALTHKGIPSLVEADGRFQLRVNVFEVVVVVRVHLDELRIDLLNGTIQGNWRSPGEGRNLPGHIDNPVGFERAILSGEL